MHRRALLVAIAALFVVVSGVAAAQDAALVREARYVAQQDGVTIGYDVYRKYETAEGYLYTAESVAYLTLFDGSHEQSTYTYECYVDSDYWPLRARHTSDASGVLTVSDTEFTRYGTDVKATMVTTVSGRQYTQEAVALGGGFCPGESLLDYLASSGKLTVGYKGEFYTWSSDRGQFDLSSIEVLEETAFEFGGQELPALRLSCVDQGVPIELLVSPEGLQYVYRIPSLRIESRLTDSDVETTELSPMTLDMVGGKGNVEVKYPLRSIQSRITISYEGSATGASCFTDNRQRIVSESVREDGTTEVVVEISVDTTDRTGQASLPVIDPSLREYLGATRHITPDYEPIKQTAQQIVGDERDVWRAVEKLLRFTHDYIQYSVNLEIFTAPDIFASRQGRCTEFAILFASLARAVGVPTRLALGFRYDGTTWVGHMWDEVYVGEWVAVDPTQGQMSPDALLVKVAHGSSLTGEENLYATLFTNHRFNIEHVALRELELPDWVDDRTGVVGSSFVSRDYAFSISVPTSWVIVEAEQAGQWMLVMQPQRAVPGASAVLTVVSLPLGARADEALSAIVTQSAAAMALEVVAVESGVQLGNTTASVATIRVVANGVMVRQDVLVAVVEDLLYVLTLTSKEAEWQLYSAELNEIANSFVTWR